MRFYWEDDGNVIVRSELCICERTLIALWTTEARCVKIWKLLIDVSYHTTLFYLSYIVYGFRRHCTTVSVVVKVITASFPQSRQQKEKKTTNRRVHRWPQHSFSSSYRNAHWSLTHKLHPSGSDMVFCCYVSYSIRGVSCRGHSGSYTLCGTTTGGPPCLLRFHRSTRRSWTWNSLSHVSCSKDTGLTDEHGTWGYCASLRFKQLFNITTFITLIYMHRFC